MNGHVELALFTAPSCNRCAKVKARLKALVAEFGEERVRYREIDVVEELDYAVSLGVLSTPAIALDGELVFSAIPSDRKLRAAINKRLEQRPS